MLEIRGLTKTYRSKTGEEVRALDGIDLAFPETGMVFILGKSGSGKSTLLNIIGGLDSYDSGEFIIKGKSSLGENPDVAAVEEIYSYLDSNEYITDEQTLAIVIKVYGDILENDTVDKIEIAKFVCANR